jgi:hypothetical protein
MFKRFPPEIMAIVPYLNHNEIGHDGGLIYKFFRTVENPLTSVWLFQFYNSLYTIG